MTFVLRYYCCYELCPFQIVATGAGAALVLDFIGFVKANKLAPAQPVSVCFSSASLALLQFVTNTLLDERIPGIHIQTALTRHEELEVRVSTGRYILFKHAFYCTIMECPR